MASPGHGHGHGTGVDSDALLLVGLAIVVGVIAARAFKRLRIPKVVGYIVIGLIVGRSGFDILSSETLDAL
jgi:Kef-type K+ transport system membrane component KefB